MYKSLVSGFAVLFLSANALSEVVPESDDSDGSAIHSSEEQVVKYGTAKTHNQNGSLVCALNCQQGTIFYPDNTCSCVCKKNYGLYQDEECRAVSWSSWSAWSKCLKSDWGGLQRRERTCQIQGAQSPGDCVGKGSEARMCTSIKKEFRIRKNLNDLTNEELHDLLQAMIKFKKDKTKRGYRNLISWHGYPGRCPWNFHIKGHNDSHCSFHHHPLFLPWHRLITVQLELGLSRYLKNKTMGIPFWDWTEEATDIPYLLRGSEIFDPILKKWIKNPFRRIFIRMKDGVKKYNYRNPNYPGLLMSRYIIKGAVRALLSHNHFNFDDQLSTIPHDQIHNCFCNQSDPECGFSLATTEYASWDPIFLFHHSAIDRLFVIRKKLEEQNGMEDWTRSRVTGFDGEELADKMPKDVADAFDWPISPFCNKTINPESVTARKGKWTMRNAFYGEQLFGYKYDNFNFGHNYKWKDLQKDFERNVIKRKFWNDDYLMTKLGNLTKANSLYLPRDHGCAMKYSNPKWNLSIEWWKLQYK